jgi:hypothetical protein
MRCVIVVALFIGASGCGTIVLPDGGTDGASDGGSDAASDGGSDAGSGPVIGRGCAANADCGAGFQCYAAAPGGYCQLAEPNDCHTDTDCPAGTVCAPRMYSERIGRCLRTCATVADCRTGYHCNVEWLFPGETTGPRSSQPVCWIPCVPGLDQYCNDSPYISSIHGTCRADGTCECSFGEANPQTGRCP